MRSLALWLILALIPAQAHALLKGSGGGASNSITATLANTARTLADRFADTYNVKDFGAVCDGSTDDTTAIQNALDTLHTSLSNGVRITFPRGTCLASHLTLYRQQILECADGRQACTLKQKSGSNQDFILSENFATLTNTNAQYGTNPNVPSWFGFRNLHIDGNASGQTSGSCVKFYGPAQIMDKVIVENCYDTNIYTEASVVGAYNGTDWKAQEEGIFRDLVSRASAHGYGWQMRGPHDSIIDNYIAFNNALTGYRSEQNSNYAGSAHIVLMHTYSNQDGTGVYIGAAGTTFTEIETDFDNFTADAAGTVGSKLYNIQCGFIATDCMVLTANAINFALGLHHFEFNTAADGIAGGNIQASSGTTSIGVVDGSPVTPSGSVTGYKIRGNFVSIGGGMLHGLSNGSSACLDVNSQFVGVKASMYGCKTFLVVGASSGNNTYDLNIYTGGTGTVVSGSFAGNDCRRINADTGSDYTCLGVTMATAAYDSAFNYNYSLAGVIAGYNNSGVQQATIKGALANDHYDFQTPTTGFSITVPSNSSHEILNPAGTLATGTINMPAFPPNGMIVSISSTQTITALTVSANSGQSIKNAITTLAAGATKAYLYRATDTTWYPIQ